MIRRVNPWMLAGSAVALLGVITGVALLRPYLGRAAGGAKLAVAETRCARCHPDVAKTHANSAHAHTLSQPGLGGLKLPASAWKRDPVIPVLYRAGWRGETLGLEAKAGDVPRWQPASWLFGSGKHGVTPVADAGGGHYLELALSYYPNRGWDFSPGFLMHSPESRMYHPAGVPDDHALFFQCFNCHATNVRDGSGDVELDQMRAGVQCERCHGPGEQHIRAAEAGLPVRGTLRLERGATAQTLIQVCGECHRTEAPPGLKPDAPALVRYAPVGLARSRCFRESQGKLSCTSCHNPHQDVDSRPEATEAVCRSCHDRKDTSIRVCPVNQTSGCVSCHMPKVEAAPHSLFTDHWIRPRGKSTNMQATPGGPVLPFGH